MTTGAASGTPRAQKAGFTSRFCQESAPPWQPPWKSADGQDAFINMHREARANSRIVARLEPGVVVEVKACDGDWCEADADGVTGYVAQGEIWGAYPGEAFK
jgi:SH3-like domain-containing protein